MALTLDDDVVEQTTKRKTGWRLTGRLMGRLLQGLMADLEFGSIRFILPGGRDVTCRGDEPGPNAVMQFGSYAGVLRLVFSGYVGLGEGYLAGDWSSPSIRTLFQFGIANQNGLRKRLSGKAPVRLLNRILRLMRKNSQSGSRRNIAHHYDLGNAFYETWLDSSMTYSSGLFAGSHDGTLEQAQAAKYRKIVDTLRIKPGDRVLEIGCGWGGFAEFAARGTGASVTAITISKEQYDYAVDRIARAGLTESVEIRLCDYRDLSGQFDHIVSIEMLEAVGEAYWPDYFQTLRQSLTDDGRAVVQVITVPDDRFENYRSKTDFIQRYIFPGGMLLSPGEMERQAESAGLGLKGAFYFGGSYAKTLDAWYDRFDENWSAVEALGFDDRFRRLWEYYLNYTAAGFHAGTIDVGQFVLTKKP